MTSDRSPQPISPLRARMIEDMSVRGFKEDTRRDYVRHVRAFATFIGRSPDTATAEDLRRSQLHQTQIGVQPSLLATSRRYSKSTTSYSGAPHQSQGSFGECVPRFRSLLIAGRA